ncbi:MAG: fimbrillin family protein [Bacteroidales bacterium]|nr:fimbrillin family protein [Bacteroidales bacterium]
MLKKYNRLFGAFCAVSALMSLSTACSSDNNLENDMENLEEREAIQLNYTCPTLEVESRGYGSVGPYIGKDSIIWNKYPVYVYSIFREADDFNFDVQDEDHLVPTFLLGGKDSLYMGHRGTVYSKETKGSISFSNTTYYPMVGTYRFMGYHVDDAKTTAAKKIENASKLQIDVEYDGTQDIMVATDTKYYSTQTARKGQIPNLVFKHQLARLNVYVVAGDTSAVVRNPKDTLGIKTKMTKAYNNDKDKVFVKKQGVFLDSLFINDQFSKGYLLVSADSCAWRFTTDKKANFKMAMDAKMIKDNLNGGQITKVPQYLGEVLVKPETSYYTDFNISEYVNQIPDTIAPDKRHRKYSKIKIAPPKGKTRFSPGYSYDVKITVYSMENIAVTAQLTPWNPGGSTTIDPDN